jgi:predicted HTH transcriptional regulator
MADTFTAAREAIEAALQEIRDQRESYLADSNTKIEALEQALEAFGDRKAPTVPAVRRKAPTVPAVRRKAPSTIDQRLDAYVGKAIEARQPEEFPGHWTPKVAKALRARGQATQAEIRKALKMPSSESTRSMRLLVRAGVAEKVGMQKSSQGPPTAVYKWIGPPAPGSGQIPIDAEHKREVVVTPGLGIREGRLQVGA